MFGRYLLCSPGVSGVSSSVVCSEFWSSLSALVEVTTSSVAVVVLSGLSSASWLLCWLCEPWLPSSLLLLMLLSLRSAFSMTTSWSSSSASSTVSGCRTKSGDDSPLLWSRSALSLFSSLCQRWANYTQPCNFITNNKLRNSKLQKNTNYICNCLISTTTVKSRITVSGKSSFLCKIT